MKFQIHMKQQHNYDENPKKFISREKTDARNQELSQRRRQRFYIRNTQHENFISEGPIRSWAIINYYFGFSSIRQFQATLTELDWVNFIAINQNVKSPPSQSGKIIPQGGNSEISERSTSTFKHFISRLLNHEAINFSSQDLSFSILQKQHNPKIFRHLRPTFRLWVYFGYGWTGFYPIEQLSGRPFITLKNEIGFAPFIGNLFFWIKMEAILKDENNQIWCDSHLYSFLLNNIMKTKKSYYVNSYICSHDEKIYVNYFGYLKYFFRKEKDIFINSFIFDIFKGKI